jgi:hypothetical protein
MPSWFRYPRGERSPPVLNDKNYSPEKLNVEKSMDMSFFVMPLYILGVCPENRDESN